MNTTNFCYETRSTIVERTTPKKVEILEGVNRIPNDTRYERLEYTIVDKRINSIRFSDRENTVLWELCIT